MDKRINKIIEEYTTNFKDNIRNKINEIYFEEQSKINDLLEFVYDYARLEIHKDDVTKRKRIKNAIPMLNRCNAKRCSGEQCTRRRKKDSTFCGTHTKGTPHGLVIHNTENENLVQKIELVAEEIGGIVYYIDRFGNVYNTEDILEEKQNPRIIAKYRFDNSTYSIPEFGIM